MKLNRKNQVITDESNVNLIRLKIRIEKYSNITGGLALLTFVLFATTVFIPKQSILLKIIRIAGILSGALLLVFFGYFFFLQLRQFSIKKNTDEND